MALGAVSGFESFAWRRLESHVQQTWKIMHYHTTSAASREPVSICEHELECASEPSSSGRDRFCWYTCTHRTQFRCIAETRSAQELAMVASPHSSFLSLPSSPEP